jgi:hypothetical protein
MAYTMADAYEAAVQCADDLGCEGCPLQGAENCANHFANVIRIQKEELESAATDTSSEKHTDIELVNALPYHITNTKSCQVMLNSIVELTDDIISSDDIDPEAAGFAGTIKGISYVLKELIGGVQ